MSVPSDVDVPEYLRWYDELSGYEKSPPVSPFIYDMEVKQEAQASAKLSVKASVEEVMMKESLPTEEAKKT